MNRNLLLFLLRLLLAVGVAFALPFSHAQWGERYPGDGQQAFGFIAIFFVIGMGASAVFVALGSLGHFMLRRKRVRVTVFTDLALFGLFAGFLVYGGVTAKYSDKKPNKSASADGGTMLHLQSTSQWPAAAELTSEVIRQRFW